MYVAGCFRSRSWEAKGIETQSPGGRWAWGKERESGGDGGGDRDRDRKFNEMKEKEVPPLRTVAQIPILKPHPWVGGDFCQLNITPWFSSLCWPKAPCTQVTLQTSGS